MGKIASLDVGTIKIGNSAITGTVQASYSISAIQSGSRDLVVPDSYNNPVPIFWTCMGTVIAGGGSNRDGSATASLTVKKGATTLFSRSQSVANGGSAPLPWSGSILDTSPGTSPTYTIAYALTQNGPASTQPSTMAGYICAMYIKR